QILGHVENGRVYGEVHPHRSDYGGTRSFRFSYSHPPLQQMPKHDEELAPLIRSVFLPEEGEIWASCDISQQEFRLVVHFAMRKRLTGAAAARDRYINDPGTDFHAYASELTGGKLSRQDGKTFNFMTIYGAGPETTSQQVKKTLSETKALLSLYGERMPFILQLADACKNAAHREGFFTLFNSARRHFNQWAPGGKLQEGAGPCERTEAERRVRDPGHPWYGRRLWRADTYKALNVLIQSAAAVQTKEWMLACFREGIVPLLQMHDSLDLSVSSPDTAEMVARLGEDIVKLEVPMKIDVSYGRTWGDAKHTWAELHTETRPPIELAGKIPDALERTACESPKLSNNSGAASDPVSAEDITNELPWEETPLTATAEMPSEPPHICIHCHRDPPNGNERASAYNGAWLHPQCEEPFIRARMAEQGLQWQSARFAQAATPPPQSEPPPASLPPPPPPPPTPSSGNGRGNGFAGFTSSIGRSGNGAARATGSKTEAERDKYTEEHAGEPFSDTDLRAVGYRLTRVFNYTLADGTLLYQQ